MRATGRVGVNLLWLIPGVVGGSEEYTLNLLRAVSDRSPNDVALRLYGQPSLAAAHPDLGERFELVTLPREMAAKPVRFALECSWLAARSRRDDVVHHGGGVLPYRARGRTIVTIHDLQPLEMPEHFSPAQRRWFAAMLPRVARSADRIITPSSFTARRVTELLSAPAERIRVVPPVHMASDIVASPSAGPVASPPGVVAGRRYLIYPAVSHPHKRHVDAVRALHLLAPCHPDLDLVLTGAPGGAADELARTVVELDLADRVRILGRVPARDLDELLRGAAGMVFPSVYEGFGNPVIEAMSRRIPVVAAEAASLPEVAGGAALLFEPRSPQALADRVHELLTQPLLAQRLMAAGEARAADFRAEAAAGALLDAYRDALA